MRQLSLRARLLAGLVVVVVAGLLAVDLVTYFVVQSFLVDRVDTQLADTAPPALDRLGRPESRQGDSGTQQQQPTSGRGPGDRRPPSYVPPGTYAEIRKPDGTTTNVVFELDQDYTAPAFPSALPGDHSATRFFNTGSNDESVDFRVRASPLPDGSTLLLAIPLTEVNETLSQLRWTELGVSLGVVALVAATAFWLVRLGLRPLDRIAVTAGEIADGNLTRRIEHTESRTEIGRLGIALNHMLESLERSFSEQKRLEERLRRFVADASHELRTPLTSIRGYAELFSRGASERPEDLARVMRRIDQESARMGILVEDLLLLARLDEGPDLKLTRVDLSQLARDAADDASVSAPGRHINVDSSGPVVVNGDEARLRQVVANLVNNALQHTPADAAVSIEVAQTDREGLVRVADEGSGVRPEEAARVFEPFYRVDKGRTRSQGGTGLGLAIVRAIVQAHGGRVSVSPNRPRGAIFEVALPR